MVYYRLYLLGEGSKRFVGFEEIDAADDDGAIEAASRHIGPNSLELWCGNRKVKSFAARFEERPATD